MDITAKNTTNLSGFRNRKSYSPEDIWAAGGTTAFGKKIGQSNKKLIDALKKSSKIDAFTEQEWENTLKQLRESK